MSALPKRLARATVTCSSRRSRRTWPHARACSRAPAALALFGALWLSLAVATPAIAVPSHPSGAAPLPASNYRVHNSCPPPAPGYASCLALRLVPKTAAARAHNHPIGIRLRRAPAHGLASEAVFGLRPSDLHIAYGLPTEARRPQTIALVDAYNDPTAEHDLGVYDTEFHLPACTRENGCFRQVNQEGAASPLPETEGGWASEITLDIETAHAICQNCHILLVEANSAEGESLEVAENKAAELGATEISNSWGGPEEGTDSAAFNHPGVVITAATGDFGYLNWNAPYAGFPGHPDYPAGSPHVVAVGGTRLEVTESSTWQNETVWNDGSTLGGGYGASGGGCSTLLAPLWQTEVADWTAVGCGTGRAAADVSADADPYSGVAVYDSTPEVVGRAAPEWTAYGGTSLASPIIAATFALAGGADGVSYPAQTLYSYLGPAALHDVTEGSNGSCEKAFNTVTDTAGCTKTEEGAQCEAKLKCVAAAGYDGPSGVGTPDGIEAFLIPPPPVVKVLAPAHGGTDGGTAVTITGEHFTGTSAVHFGTAAASEISVKSPTEMTVKSPPNAEGEVDVTVTTPGGTSGAVEPDRFTYQPSPVVSNVEPREGPAAGSTTVTITGEHLEGAGAVDFGATAGSEIVVVSPTEVRVKSPPHAASVVDVTVGTANGPSATGPGDRFTYLAPASGAATGSTSGTGNIGPGGGTTTGATPASHPAFALVGRPVVNRASGAVTFTLSLPAGGMLNWNLTFRNGSFGVVASARRLARVARCARHRIRLAGRCRADRATFGAGSWSFNSSGAVKLTVKPGAYGRRALRRALRRHGALTVSASFAFLASGASARQTRATTIGVWLKRASARARRR
ncbi:MAG: IPT/TIG domain-containing protein [Solirubrobacteraceae bacterium]